MARLGRLMTNFGGAGSAVGLLCCFTPILPIVLGGAGMTGALSFLYRDSILLPFAGLSLLILALGLWKMRRGQ
tara:strand:+ start:365 stop:583 length:219 start_codon:yes stop_codon:yes gene_type:complete